MISEDSAILMHKTWPSLKFPDSVCVSWDDAELQGWEVPASPWPHAAAVLWGGFRGDQRWGWQERRRRRFLCCAFVSGGSGITFLRVSARWEAPRCGFSLLGAEQSPGVDAGLSSAGAGGDQPELEEMMGRDELHPSVGIPVHPSWVPTQDLSGDQVCTQSL